LAMPPAAGQGGPSTLLDCGADEKGPRTSTSRGEQLDQTRPGQKNRHEGQGDCRGRFLQNCAGGGRRESNKKKKHVGGGEKKGTGGGFIMQKLKSTLSDNPPKGDGRRMRWGKGPVIAEKTTGRPHRGVGLKRCGGKRFFSNQIKGNELPWL